MSKHGPIRAERPAPSVAKLIHLLIEERAKVILLRLRGSRTADAVADHHRDQARREIESEVLTTKGQP